MDPSKKVILCLSLATLLFAGCLACGKTNEYSKVWTQPDLYDSFPPGGEKAGFKLTQAGETGTKMAFFEDMAQAVRLVLRAPENEKNVSFHVSTRSALPDETAARILNKTLEDLGMEGASVPDWSFSFEKESCL